MKINSMQLHIVLVVAVICLIIYVFYISRDIASLERQVGDLQDSMDKTLKQVVARFAGGGNSNKPIAAAFPDVGVVHAVERPAPSFQPSDEAFEEISFEDLKISAAQEPEFVTVNDGEGADPIDELDDVVNSKDVVIEAATTAPAPTQKTDVRSMSWNNIKDLCRKSNIPIKGFTKEQLIQKLSETL